MGCGNSKQINKVPPTFDEWNGDAAGSFYSNYAAAKGESKSASDLFWTTDCKSAKPIMFSQQGLGSSEVSPPMTVSQMFQQAVQNSGTSPFLRKEDVPSVLARGAKAPPSAPTDQWKTWTYQQTYDECKEVARGFMALGVDTFSAVTIYGFNSPEWVMAELACVLSGGIAAGIYPSDTAEQVKYKALHSGAVVAVVQNAAKAQMFLDIQGELPKLKGVVVWDTTDGELPASSDGVQVMSWDDLRALGNEGGTAAETALQNRIDAQMPGNCCAYIYTSGTTGSPKAVMISHDNILFESRVAMDLIPGMGTDANDPQERVISYLPLSHVAGMMVDIISPITIAATKPGYVTLHFARPYDLKAGTLGDRLRAVRPTLFLGVPRVWEKIQEKMMATVAANPPTGAKLKLIRWAKGLGLEHQNNCQLGGSGNYGAGYALADKLVLSTVKVKLGLDACKFCFTGAAPIKTETLQFYGALGIQINEVYGMSECTGATTWSTDNAHVWGSCGWSLPSTEVTVRNVETNAECPAGVDGEICYRGRHIMMGYMGNPDLGAAHMKEIEGKNRSAIDDDGWLHSGDKGQKDLDGMVRITGRYKELIIGAGGENVAPVPVEDGVKSRCAAISNIMMVGDKRKYNVALVTLKAVGATGELPGGDELDPVASACGDGTATTVSGAIAGEGGIAAAIEQAIKETNLDTLCCPMPPARIQKFTILPADFSVVGEELTPTFKLKRSVAEKKYTPQIEAMYKSKDAYVPFK
jgi:long-chain-fatty-acid--CoA ligase ACSBG